MLKIAFSPIYKYELPEGHRFPMIKYELLPEQLLYEGTITKANLFAPRPVAESIILQTHTNDYWQQLKNQTLPPKAIRKIGFPLRPELVERGRHIVGGTLQCVRYAAEFGVALNVAGGTHHAYRNSGEGFCLLNDFAIVANYLLEQNEYQKIMIVDLDVHQGNGTAKIFEKEPRVFTFSMHGAKNYPSPKEKSDLDIGLPDHTNDQEYLHILKNTLPGLLDAFKPELVLYLSGVDVLQTDKLGRLSLSIEGCQERDKFVFLECKNRSIPVAVSMGGGYSPRIASIIEAHANTFRAARQIYF